MRRTADARAEPCASARRALLQPRKDGGPRLGLLREKVELAPGCAGGTIKVALCAAAGKCRPDSGWNCKECEAAVPAGKHGHFSPTAASPGLRSESCIPRIMQWCLPWRRQQSGRLASGSEAKRGAISIELKISIRKSAMARRILSAEYTEILKPLYVISIISADFRVSGALGSG